ncbi:uncharacterized protein [Patagioenas fasciata]|uniref:uncharacterized protein isoform X1 n=1 Tax=Patagioenas fasciata TaxID=372321 RepID=UPI0032E88B0C
MTVSPLSQHPHRDTAVPRNGIITEMPPSPSSILTEMPPPWWSPWTLPVQLVDSSLVMAFEEVCPECIDLIHKSYHKLCNLLVDVEEWGQVVIINMLTRYVRTQFLSPNQNVVMAVAQLCSHLSPQAEVVSSLRY